MMITVIVDEIVEAHPAGAKAGTYRRVEREKFDAVASVAGNMCVGDELFFAGAGEGSTKTRDRMIVQRCRTLIRTNTGGSRVMSMWLDVIAPELDELIELGDFLDYETWAKHHEVW